MNEMSYVDELLVRMHRGGQDGYEASLELYLQIEREVRQRLDDPDYDGMIEETIGEERAARKLSAEESTYATERLLEIVTTEDPPAFYFVHALGATLDRRMLEPLLAIIDRYGEDPDQQMLINAAMFAFGPFRGAFDDDAIRRLAERGADADNRDSARRFLDPATGYRRIPPEEW